MRQFAGLESKMMDFFLNWVQLKNDCMLRIDPKQITTKDLHQYLVGTVAPRPIAFVSTMDENGTPNIAPYSFFNVFSSNPPTLVFSSNRRVRNNTVKDTLRNVRSTGEVVINVVSYNIVQQMTIASIEFDSDVSEFEKSGLTPISSEIVKPYRIKESLVHFECKVDQIIPLGAHGGAGHLIVCHIELLHVNSEILDDNNKINPHKIDLMGRMGRAYYTRASGESIYTIYRGTTNISIGFDQLPESLKKSHILSANNLGQLAGITQIPSEAEFLDLQNQERIKKVMNYVNPIAELHRIVKVELDKEHIQFAAQVAWLADYLSKSVGPKN